MQRNSARAEIGLVVTDPNIVEWLRTDDGDVDRAMRSPELVHPRGRAQRGPKPGEPRPENENTCGGRHRHIVTPRRFTDKSGRTRVVDVVSVTMRCSLVWSGALVGKNRRSSAERPQVVCGAGSEAQR